MRYNKRYIIYTIISTLLPALVLVPILMMAVFTTSPEESDEIIINSNVFGIDSFSELYVAIGIVTAIVAVAIIGFSYLWWAMTRYTIDEQGVTLNAGVVFRRNVTLPYQKIHAITVDRPLLLRFFGLSRLALDSGNTAKQNNEIVIYDTEANVKLLEKKLHALLTNGNIEEAIVEPSSTPIDYKVDARLACQYLLNNLWLYLLMIIALGAGIFCVAMQPSELIICLLPLILPVGVFILFALITFAVFGIRYHDYTISIKEGDVIVSFGLLDKKRVVIAKSKIKAISIRRDLIQKITGYCSIEAEIVGLKSSEDQSEIAVTSILPFVKTSKALELLSVLGDSYCTKPLEHKSPKKALPFFFLLPIAIVVIIALAIIVPFVTMGDLGLLILGAFIGYGTLGLLLIIVVLACVARTNQGVSLDSDNLYLAKGVLVQKYYIIPWKNVVSVHSYTTPLRKACGICTLIVSSYATKLECKKTISMLDQVAYQYVLENFLEKK